jgi:virulence-associated protein VagC
MATEHIVTLSASAELALNQEILRRIGVGAGDKIKITIEGRKLIVRPLNEAELEAMMDEAMEALMERRSKLFERLAEGAK